MTDRPILFSAPMVRAILDGQKTQTRRVVAWKPGDEARPTVGDDLVGEVSGDGYRQHGPGWTLFLPLRPYALPGDRLWVREPWRTLDRYDALPPRDVPQDAPIVYSTTGAEWDGVSGRYRHARFMPRRFSRITLAVADVRVERLHTITADDARAEGVEALGRVTDPRGAFCALWCSINGEESWQSNPWVWAITFLAVTP